MELEFTTKLDKMRLIDVKPQHDTFGLPDARLVAPGHPERSVLLHRMTPPRRGPHAAAGDVGRRSRGGETDARVDRAAEAGSGAFALRFRPEWTRGRLVRSSRSLRSSKTCLRPSGTDSAMHFS